LAFKLGAEIQDDCNSQSVMRVFQVGFPASFIRFSATLPGSGLPQQQPAISPPKRLVGDIDPCIFTHPYGKNLMA
jgi:hypothetical protein